MSSNVVSYKDIVNCFNKAVNNPENYTDDKIDWNFVDADINFYAAEVNMELPENFYEIFDYLAARYEADNVDVSA